MDTTTIRNDEIFSLFQSEKILKQTSHKYISDRFKTTSNKELFKHFNAKYQGFDSSPVIQELLYCSYIFPYFCTEDKVTFPDANLSSFDHPLDLHVENLSTQPHSIISIYYSIGNLLKRNKLLNYSDFKIKKYKLSNDKSNTTHNIKDARESLFFPLINYTHGRTDNLLLISSTVHRLLFCHAPNSSQILPRQICFQTA